MIGRAIHLCVDMQRLFADDTPWHTPWMNRVLPRVVEIVEAHAPQTIFTRFMPPKEPEDMPGAWRAFYQYWREITRLDAGMFDLVPPLIDFVPPALVLDKPFFSPFHGTKLADRLRARGVETLVITGAETDMCVLSAVLDAVDLGCRVILPEDALCSSSDEMHESVLSLYRNRFSIQIRTMSTAELLETWP